MNWRNFFVVTGFGVFVTAILFLVGEKELAVIMMIGYILYATINGIKDTRKEKVLYSKLNMIEDENLIEILICYFTKRHPNLKKSVENRIIKEIYGGNYTISSSRIVAMPKTPPKEPEGGYTYYLTMENREQYKVRSLVYNKAKIGDVLWTVNLPDKTIRVLQSEKEYYNMFTYGLDD